MSAFVITAVRVENGQVTRARIQKVIRAGRADDAKPGLESAIELDHPQITALLEIADVFCVSWNQLGEFELGSRVTHSGGADKLVISIDDDGTPNDDLKRLSPLH